jgi:hypothetical protein
MQAYSLIMCFSNDVILFLKYIIWRKKEEKKRKCADIYI